MPKLETKNQVKQDDGLPYEPTTQIVDPNTLRWLFIAPPGFGKSELFGLFKDSLMIACEEGHKFIQCHKIIVDEWKGQTGHLLDDDKNMHMSFIEAVDRITSSERFRFISIDTLDALVKKCIDYHVGKANQEHLSELGEYGKGYDLGQNKPIRQAIDKIFATGRGLGLITHQQTETKSFSKGPKTKKETTLPNGITKFIVPQMDIVIHGEFGAKRDDNKHRDRIIRSEGTEDILAKNRGGILPPAWISPLDPQKRVEQIWSFFNPDEKKRKAAIDAAYKEYTDLYQE